MSLLNSRVARLRWLVCVAALLAGPVIGAEPAQQREVQAVFVLNLTRFIRWPESAFPSADAPLTIGVLPKEPVGALLAVATRGEMSGKHPIVIREIRSDADLDGCHLVFLDKLESALAAQMLTALRTKPILTVGEADGFLRVGGHVQFFNRGGQVKLRLELRNLSRSDLTPSAQLLRVAELVQ